MMNETFETRFKVLEANFNANKGSLKELLESFYNNAKKDGFREAKDRIVEIRRKHGIDD